MEASVDGQRMMFQQQLSTKDAEHQTQLAQVRKTAEAQAKTQIDQWRKQMTQKDSEHQKQLAELRGIAEAEAKAKSENWDKQLAVKESEHQKQLAELRKTTSADAERLQRRAEADIADLKATISRLEVDLMKVRIILFFPISEYSGALTGHGLTGK